MSQASPTGALDALLARTEKFLGHEVAITCGAMLALESLTEEERANGNFAAWTLVAVSILPIGETLPALRSRRGILPLVLSWAGKLSPEARKAAISTAEAAFSAYRESVCEYTSSVSAESRGVECGNAIASAGFFMREYGMTFRQYFALPASRANALYAAWCEAQGMRGKNTFYSREVLAAAPAIMEQLNFDLNGRG